MKNNYRIEFPAIGRTYAHNWIAVYRYGTYPRSSVLAGQSRREFIDTFETLAEARAAYPGAEEQIGEPLTGDFV